MITRKAVQEILEAAAVLDASSDPACVSAVERIKRATYMLEE
jgi:hypothetical protein